MSFISFYILFAVTTAIVAVYELFWPVISQLKITHKDIDVIKHWKTSLTTLFVGALLFAPVIFPLCIVPTWSNKFKDFLARELEKTP